MAAPMMQLPAWRAPDPIDLNGFAKPMANALMQWRQDQQAQQKKNALLEGLARTPGIGLAQAEALSQHPEMAGKVWAQHLDPMNAINRQKIEAEMGLIPLKRQQIEHGMRHSEAQLAEQRRMNNITAGQLKSASPEGRAEHAIGAGLQRSTPEFNEFVYGIKRPDPFDEMIRGAIPRQPQQQQQQPQGQIIPQSAPVQQRGQIDPNLIPAQVAQQQPVAPQQQAQSMVTLPGMGQVPMGVAEMMLLKAARDKNQPMADVINQAIGKVPKALQDDIGKKQIESNDQIARLDAIQADFRPEYQTWEETLKQRGLAFMDSVGAMRGSISPQHAAEMDQYVRYRQSAFDNMNRYIKEITGAQMSETEAGRLRKAIPDPQKDSPREFQTKLNNAIALSKLTHARYTYMQRNGVNLIDKMDPSQMRGIINQRANEAERLLRQSNPEMPQPQIDMRIKGLIKTEFGI